MAANIYQTIINAESGGKNVNNYMFDSHHTASGYFQITDSTWMSTPAGQASGVTHAMNADFATQQNVASQLIARNGLNDWAPYDHINSNVSSYDQTKLSGPGGSPVAGGNDNTIPPTTGGSDAATSTYTKNADGTTTVTAANGTQTTTTANPSSVPVAIATGADEQSKTAASNTQATIKAATGIYGQSFGTLSDGAMRIALVALGLVLLAGALYLVATEQGADLLKKMA